MPFHTGKMVRQNTIHLFKIAVSWLQSWDCYSLAGLYCMQNVNEGINFNLIDHSWTTSTRLPLFEQSHLNSRVGFRVDQPNVAGPGDERRRGAREWGVRWRRGELHSEPGAGPVASPMMDENTTTLTLGHLRQRSSTSPLTLELATSKRLERLCKVWHGWKKKGWSQ